MSRAARRNVAVLVGTAAVAVVLTGAARPARKVTLVADGKPAATIVLAADATKAAQLAAYELREHVRLMTGAALPVVTEGEETAGIPVYVGVSAATKKLGVTEKSFKEQEYAVRFAPRAIVLAGRDAPDRATVVCEADDPAACRNLPGFWEEQGSLHAVYDFLQIYCGVRWLNPTDSGTVCPQKKTLAVTARDMKRKPGFEYRDALAATGDNVARYDAYTALWTPDAPDYKAWDALGYADLHAKYPDAGRYEQARQAKARLFLLRMKNGGRVNRCNHSLYGYYTRFWNKNAKGFVEFKPDMFAKGYQGEPPQMCYTSRDLILQQAADAREYYDGKKTGGELGIFWNPQLPNMFPVEPMDNSSFCTCDACRAWLDTRKAARDMYSTGTYSDYFFNFINEVAKELKKTHPKESIVTLAYASHATPPKKVKLDPNVAVQFCFAANRSPFAVKEYEHEVKLLKEWARDGTDRPLYLWLYYTFPVEGARNAKYHCFPGFFARTVDKQMKMFKKYGYRGMFHCGYGQEVEAYVTFRLMDDPSLDVETLLDEYFSGLYGAAAGPMKKLYTAIEKTYCDPALRPKERVSGAETSWGYLGTEARMKEFGDLLAAARTAAKTDRERRNVQLFDHAVWSYMVAGRKQYLDRKSAPIPAATAPRVPAAGGNAAKVDWSKAAPLDERWYDRGSTTRSARKLSGRIAHDGTYLYLELADACDTSKLVASPMVFPYDDWEVFVAAQRAVPYRQYSCGPKNLIVALSHGEVNFRMNVPVEKHGVTVASDTSAPNRWVTRMAIPLEGAIPGGVRPGGKAYMNVIRVTGPAITGTGKLGIDTWVSYCSVHEVDRLAEITLAP